MQLYMTGKKKASAIANIPAMQIPPHLQKASATANIPVLQILQHQKKYHRSYLYNTPNSCYDNHIFGERLFSEHIYSRKALISGFNFRNKIRYEKQQNIKNGGKCL